MKRNRIHLFLLALTIFSLVLLVIIQVSWILRSAKLQEKQFNHVVALAMDRIAESLSCSQGIGEEFYSCLHETGTCARLRQNQKLWGEINSLVRADLDYYNINLDFEFDIVAKGDTQACPFSKQIHVRDDLATVLEELGFELLIRFPKKGEFVRAQMGYVFISSIVLLLLVSVSFAMIYNYYKRQRRFSANIIDFVNNITHELKTPLTNIALANSMISKSLVASNDKKVTTYSDVIRKEQQQLKEKVELLLKTSLFENGLKTDTVNFDPLLDVENIVSTYSIQLKHKNGEIKIECPDKKISITGNPDLFSLAVGNLIDNAIKYNESKPEIKITLACHKGEVVIKVADNGIGIHNAHLSSIFDKYYRVPTGDVHNNKGFGLGLFLVKQAIKAMNGTISVASTPGKGSIFSIKLQGQCK